MHPPTPSPFLLSRAAAALRFLRARGRPPKIFRYYLVLVLFPRRLRLVELVSFERIFLFRGSLRIEIVPLSKFFIRSSVFFFFFWKIATEWIYLRLGSQVRIMKEISLVISVSRIFTGVAYIFISHRYDAPREIYHFEPYSSSVNTCFRLKSNSSGQNYPGPLETRFNWKFHICIISSLNPFIFSFL